MVLRIDLERGSLAVGTVQTLSSSDPVQGLLSRGISQLCHRVKEQAVKSEQCDISKWKYRECKRRGTRAKEIQ